MDPLSIAILAGGQSSRMGEDKAFVRVRRGPLIEDVLAGLAGLGAETFIVTNQPGPYRYLGLPLHADRLPGQGALGGLYTAVSAAREPRVLCVACDMPFVVRPLLEFLIGLAPEADVVVPRLAGEAEPFRAVYSRACAAPIARALQAGRKRMISFHSEVRVRYVDEAEIDPLDPDHRSFFNVNTPADLERARALAAAEGHSP